MRKPAPSFSRETFSSIRESRMPPSKPNPPPSAAPAVRFRKDSFRRITIRRLLLAQIPAGPQTCAVLRPPFR